MDTASKKGNTFTIDPRLAAVKALVEWEKTRGNLDFILGEYMSQLRKENRSFFLEVVKGTVRNLTLLDYKLGLISKHPLESLFPEVRNLLRIASYQIEFMNVPKPVTVHIMVELSKKMGHGGIPKLTNGILRRLADGVPVSFPEDPVERLSLLYSHPEWLVRRWVTRFGEGETEALLRWNNTPPLLEIRVNRARIPPGEFMEICRRKSLPIHSSFFGEAFAVEPSGPIDKFPGYKEGFFWIQSFSALLPAVILNPLPGEKILELCAAPGGKSCQMAEMCQDEVEILAVDTNEERLKKVEENKRRLGFRYIHSTLADGRECGKLFPSWADAVLLDAPCSATGSFRRKADARWRKEPGDLPAYAALQRELLESAALAVKPGGRIVYSTCSLEPEENEEIVRPFLKEHPGFDLEDPRPSLPKSILDNCSTGGDFLQILPQKCKMDGFFVARLKRK